MVASTRRQNERGGHGGHEESHEGGMGQMMEALERPAELAKEYPISSMLVVFGIGLGVGVVLAQAACSSLEETFREPTMTERWGRQISRSMQEMIPDAVQRYMAQYQR